MKRTLKIDKCEINHSRKGRGPYHKRLTVPRVRLSGKWLQAAGFPPGAFVEVTVPSTGVIELRLCGTAPAPSKEFQITAMRLDHAIAADEARRKVVGK